MVSNVHFHEFKQMLSDEKLIALILHWPSLSADKLIFKVEKMRHKRRNICQLPGKV